MSQTVLEKDINDLFDSITFSEDQIWKDAYEKGLEKGKEDGKLEGFHLGYHLGAEIGGELGFYKQIINTIELQRPELLNEKTHPIIKKIQSMIEEFPPVNSEDQDIIYLRDSIRSRYKQLCSLLKIEPLFAPNNQLSF